MKEKNARLKLLREESGNGRVVLMKKMFGQIFLMVLVALGASWGAVRVMEKGAATKTESVYDRVMRTRTLRCGYFVWPPYLSKDTNSGKLSGLFVDYMDALSAVTDLKVEWAQELNFGTFLEDLASGRVDMECAGGWPNAKRGQQVFYPKPYAYIAYVALVRPDDHRFDTDPAAISDPQVRVATMDGEMTSILRRLRFPETQDVSLPQNSPFSDVIMNVVTGKADITFSDTLTAQQYLKDNPGKLRVVSYSKPLYLLAMTPTVTPDARLKQLVDVANDQLLSMGVIDSMLRKYETPDAQFLRMAEPFLAH